LQALLESAPTYRLLIEGHLPQATAAIDAMQSLPPNTSPSSLSDLSDRSEEKTGLKQISRVFEANSWLFNEKMREIWPNRAFP
jgi:hypothetical protein